jgi:hypothetical protein
LLVATFCSEFELEYLLLEGHCFETTMGNPPRGLQITLGTETQPVVVDTIVMANLGYFQLKANPGAWILRLRQGRSADIFDIVRLIWHCFLWKRFFFGRENLSQMISNYL